MVRISPPPVFVMVYTQMLEQCKRNDSRAQRALYDHFKARLMGLCRRYAKSREDAQDMLQESFVKIFTRIGQLHSADKLEQWMKSIVVRTAIDHYNKRKRQEPVYAEVEYDIAGTDYEHVLESVSDEQLIAVINGLPEGCRMVFNLFEVEGYTHAEISDLLQISEGTSRSQLHHAKLLLKQKLNALGVKRYEKFA
jgi:RNA polymerase sigma factor (sigma-70 family)